MVENKEAPKIRFAGFTDAWEQCKLGELGETYTGLSGKTKDDFGHGEGKFVTYMNVFANTVADSKLTESVVIDAKQNEVKYGDVFFTTSSETPEEVGMSSVWIENREYTYLNSFCFGYRPKEKFDHHYLAYMLRSSNVRKKITFLAQGISRYNISKTKVMEIQVPVPRFAEQSKIGEYFKQLDHLITLHQRKYGKLVVMKKSMLEKMFPKNGSSVPEIRFAGFTDAWEQRKLGEIVQIKDSARIPNALWRKDGVPYLRSSNLDNATDEMLYISQKDYEMYKSKTGAPELGDVLFNSGGNIGTAILKSDDKPVYVQGGAVLYIKTSISEKINGLYLKYYFETPIQKKYILLACVGGTIKHFTLVPANAMPIAYPKTEEQMQIGLFFSNLDNLITLHQSKLEKLKNIKKSMLEKMFV